MRELCIGETLNLPKIRENEKRVNKQCLSNTPRRVTVYHKNYFGNKISSCKCQMGVHHVGMISNCSIKNW